MPVETAVVSDHVLDPVGKGVEFVDVEIRARGSHTDLNAPVYTADGTIIGTKHKTTGADGAWNVTLPISSELIPSGSWYEALFTFESGETHGPIVFRLPAGGPYTLDAVADLPPDLDPGADPGIRKLHVPPGFGGHRWHRDSQGRQHWVFYGDSIVAGLIAFQGWVERIRRAVNPSVPAARGFRPLYLGDWSFTGTAGGSQWQWPDAPPDADQFDAAPHLTDITLGVGDTRDYRPAMRFTDSNQAYIATYTRGAADLENGILAEPPIRWFDVFLADAFGADDGEYSVDGGSWEAIPAAESGAYTETATGDLLWRRHRIDLTAAPAESTIRFRGPSSGFFYLLGGTPYYTDEGGVVVHNVGRNGAGVRDTVGPTGDRWAFMGAHPGGGDSIVNDATGFLFVTDFMGADTFDGGSIDTYEDNLRALFARARAAGASDLAMVAPNDITDAQKAALGVVSGDWIGYRERARQVAKDLDVLFFSMHDQWGDEPQVHGSFMQAPTVANNVFTDGVHPGQSGHDDYARRFLHAIGYRHLA